MRFTCVTRDDQNSRKYSEALIAFLLQRGWIHDDNNPQMVITLGGDGTILSAIQKYIYLLNHVAFIGINSGTVGFLSQYRLEEINQFIQDIFTKQANYEYKRLIQAVIDDNPQLVYFALNDIRIQSCVQSQVLQLYIDGQDFGHTKGSGICVSSPTGSSAINRSLGGTIIDEKLWQDVGLQLNEILPLKTSRYPSLKSPLLLAPEKEITVFAQNYLGNFDLSIMCYDNSFTQLQGKKKITLRLSNKVAYFAVFKAVDYIERLKTLF